MSLLSIKTIEYSFYIQDFWATCACPEKESVHWIHCIEYIFFIIQNFEQSALALKNRICPEIFYCIEIFFIFQDFLATWASPDNRVCPEFFKRGGSLPPFPPPCTPLILVICSLRTGIHIVTVSPQDWKVCHAATGLLKYWCWDHYKRGGWPVQVSCIMWVSPCLRSWAVSIWLMDLYERLYQPFFNNQHCLVKKFEKDVMFNFQC